MDKVRLGDVATLITKGTTPTTLGYYFVGNGINFVKIESITDDGEFIKDKFAYINEECNSKLSRSQLQENDILFSIAGAIGRVAIVKKDILPANTNQALAIIRIPKGVFDYNFLKYVLRSPIIYKQCDKQKQGVAQINLSLKNICDFEIPLLSLEQQKEIVDVLDKLTDLIDKRKKQLEKLDELVKARFVEMFGDKNFTICKLETLCKVGSSKRVYQNQQSISGIPFLRIADLNERIDTGNMTNDLYIPVETYQELLHNNLVPKENDILITSRGTLGKCYIVSRDDQFYFQDGMISWLSNIDKRISSIYLSYLFSMPIIQDQIQKQQAGSTVAYLSIAMLKKLDILVPSIELQNQFAAFVAQVDKSKAELQKCLEKLELLKNALMQKYFG